MEAQPLVIPVGSESVSGLLLRPDDAKALFVFAHGAGVGMRHANMESNARGLAERGIATLRYQFPYMEKGSKRPDPPRIAHAAVRAAVAQAAQSCAGDLPLFAGGRSYGGRMTSQAQALAAAARRARPRLPRLPASPGGRAGNRARRSSGAQSKFRCCSSPASATRSPISTCSRASSTGLGDRAILHVVASADHTLKVPASSGRTNAEAEAKRWTHRGVDRRSP